MRNVLLIMSSAPCNQELQFLFGAIPAARVPVGGRTLLDLQLDAAGDNFHHIYVTWPEMSSVPYVGGNVYFFPSAEDQSLPYQLRRALRLINAQENAPDVCVHVLWGDTLVTKWLKEPAVGVVSHPLGTSAHWQFLDKDNVFAGYFACRLSELTFTLDSYDTVNSAVRYMAGRLPNVSIDEHWLDFGHLSTYFSSKREFLSRTTRHFNGLTNDGHLLTKRSTNVKKVNAEREWFLGLPRKLSTYVPRIVHYDDGEYTMEYLPLPTLSELYVYGKLDDRAWTHVLRQTLCWVEDAHQACHGAHVNDFYQLAVTKTWSRLDMLEGTVHLPVADLHGMAQLFAMNVNPKAHHRTIMHGDLCFSNIMLDQRTDRVLVFDPRGLDAKDRPSLYGDVRYELAKLLHSVIGYDHAVAKQPLPTEWEGLADPILRYGAQRFGISSNELWAVTGLLFISMLPLHSDDKQRQLRFVELARKVLNQIQ